MPLENKPRFINRISQISLDPQAPFLARILNQISLPAITKLPVFLVYLFCVVWLPLSLLLHFLGLKTSASIFWAEECIPRVVRVVLFYGFGSIALLTLVGEMQPEIVIAIRQWFENEHYSKSIDYEKEWNLPGALNEASEAVRAQPDNKKYQDHLQKLQKHYKRIMKSYQVPAEGVPTPINE